MKKETFAVLLLALLLGLSILNAWALDKITGRLIGTMDACRSSIDAENWDDAAKQAETALDYWGKKGAYTHIVLRHSEIDALTENFYRLLERIYSRDGAAASCEARLTMEALESMSSIEKLRPGSIF